MRLLIAEDEADMRNLLCERLQNEGYIIDVCKNGKEAIDYLALGNYDGAIIDIMLPKVNGLTVLKEIRSLKIYTPVMFLSALNEADDIVNGLDSGADDYMTKPFDFDVLLARIRVMLRKTVGVHENVYRCGDLVVNESDMEVFRGNDKIELTAREYKILLFLIRNTGRILTREQIISSVWNDGEELTSNVVDVYIRFLRKKIDSDHDKKLIQTIRGIGYCLKEEE
ncbi:MAG: response regulator transcription factor [Lachnospiraceae bacterium]|nr:response regulator transcription factor [Lachnospiraceae bacterium]